MTPGNPIAGFGAATLSNAVGAAQAKPPMPPKGASDPVAAEHAAKEFEGWMIGQMLQPMFKSIKTNGMFGGGYGEDSFRELLVDEYGKKVAESGGLGIADMVRREILKAQEVAS
jgi:Rod binding domain-containing protein